MKHLISFAATAAMSQIKTWFRTTWLALRQGWRRWLPFDTPRQCAASLLKLGGILMIVLPLCWWRAAYPLVHFYTPKTMTTLSGKTQTQCVGRYLIEVPVELGTIEVNVAEFYWGLDTDFKTVEVSVKANALTHEQFVDAVNKRITQLKTERNDDLNIPLLLGQEVWDTPNGKVMRLRLLDGSNYTSAPIRSEVHMLVGNSYAVAFSVTYDQDPLERPRGFETYKHIDPSPMEARLRKVAENMRGYTDPKKAPEGFCIEGVVMNEKTMGYDVETTLFSAFGNKASLPHFEFNLNMRGQFDNADGDNLHQRATRIHTEVLPIYTAEGARLIDVRKAERSINGIPSLEWINATHVKGGVTFNLQAETAMSKEKQSLERPFFTLYLNLGETGVKDKYSPLTQDQALKLWDDMINSIRLSPANGGDQINPSTGAMTKTAKVNEECPRTGVWEARLPPNHLSAKSLASSHYRFKEVTAGLPMPEVYAEFMFPKTAAADNAAVTWHWVKPDWKA